MPCSSYLTWSLVPLSIRLINWKNLRSHTRVFTVPWKDLSAFSFVRVGTLSYPGFWYQDGRHLKISQVLSTGISSPILNSLYDDVIACYKWRIPVYSRWSTGYNWTWLNGWPIAAIYLLYLPRKSNYLTCRTAYKPRRVLLSIFTSVRPKIVFLTKFIKKHSSL